MVLKEQQKIRISGCKIDKETIYEICGLIETENEKLKKQHGEIKKYVTFEIEGKTKDITANTVNELIQTKFPRDLERIHLYSHTTVQDSDADYKINLILSFGTFSAQYINVEGSDENWIAGISKKIQEIFESKKIRTTSQVNGLLDLQLQCRLFRLLGMA